MKKKKVTNNVFKRGDMLIEISVLFLALFGVLMIGSATGGGTSYFGLPSALVNMAKQFLFLALSFSIMLFLMRYFKREYISLNTCIFLYNVMIVLMCICRKWNINGAYAWIKFPYGFSFQPAELMKVIMIVILSFLFTGFVDSFKVKGKFSSDVAKDKFYKNKAKCCLGIPVFLIGFVAFVGIVVQNDTGTTFILLIICSILFFATTNKYFRPAKTVAFLLVILFLVFSSFFIQGYQADRISSWLNPLNDPLGKSYQLVNSLIAFSNGGFSGLGLGSSTQKYGYIPESHNDFIGAIVFEELGVLGLLCIAIPTLIIISQFMSYAYRVDNQMSKSILLGVATYFLVHFLVNLGGVSGLIPMTGVPLLLVSSGGSSTLSALFAVGIGQSIIRRFKLGKD